jgi:hypothetical protein
MSRRVLPTAQSGITAARMTPLTLGRPLTRQKLRVLGVLTHSVQDWALMEWVTSTTIDRSSPKARPTTSFLKQIPSQTVFHVGKFDEDPSYTTTYLPPTRFPGVIDPPSPEDSSPHCAGHNRSSTTSDGS